MEKRVLPSCAVLLLLASSAGGQSTAVLGQDNATFARKLFEIGYRDLAERLCEVISGPENEATADENEIREVRSLGFEFALDAARREPDLLKRKEAIQKVIEEKRAFIGEISRTRAAEYARASLPEDYRLLGETLTGILKDQKITPETATGLRQEGLEFFSQAEEALQERLERFDEERTESGSQGSYALRQYELAMFSLAQTYYFRSLLYAAEDPERKKVLKKAVSTFEDFGLDFPESLNSYVAAIYEGLCHRDGGDVRRALSAFDGAIDLAKTYRPLDDQQYDVPAEAADIISQAALQKILLLKQEKRYDEADSAAQEFFRSIPDPWSASHALPLAVAQAEALTAAGKHSEAASICDRVIERDPESPWANSARDLLAKFGTTGSMDPDQLLKIAQDQLVRGEFSRALQISRSAITLAQGTTKKDDIGAAAYDLIGIAYLRQGRTLEASVAFDAGPELFPAGKRAPEVLYKSARLYLDLAAKEKRPFYRKRATERMRQLATQYPDHSLAQKVVIADGHGLESEEKWTEAIEIYKKVPKDAKVYPEAHYRLGYCLYALARTTQRDENASALAKKEATAQFEQARTTLALARATSEERAAETLDVAEQRELLDIAFNALSLEIQLLLDTDKVADTKALLEEGEEKFGSDEERRARLWNLRIQSLLAQQRFEDAISIFEPLQLASPDSAGTTAAAFQLAVALDTAAGELTDGEAQKARELWNKAAIYYQQSVGPILERRAPLDFDRLDAVADRLLALGLHVNGVAETADSFADWEGTPTTTALWDSAARIYSFMLSQGPSQRRQIQLARTYGLLGRYEESADAYARIFDTTKVILREGSTVRIDPQVSRNNPELIAAFLEYAVAEHRAGKGSNEKNRMERAAQSIGDMAVALKTSSPDTRIFWQVKYAQLRSLYDRGLYPEAKLLVGDVERTTNDFDQGKFGYKEKFLSLKEEVHKKVPK